MWHWRREEELQRVQQQENETRPVPAEVGRTPATWCPNRGQRGHIPSQRRRLVHPQQSGEVFAGRRAPLREGEEVK